jgi:hypothetical protein
LEKVGIHRDAQVDGLHGVNSLVSTSARQILS